MNDSYDPQGYWERVNSHRKSIDFLRAFYDEINSLSPSAGKEHLARANQMEWMRSACRQYGWKTLLDAGCGPGFWFQLWRDEGISFAAVDRARSALPNARAMGSRLDLQVRVEQAPLSQLPFGDKEFDVAVTVKVLLHTPPDEIVAAMRELGRVGKYVMLLEFASERVIETQPHVFQHDYAGIAGQLGFRLLKSEPQPGYQRFFVMQS
ncbi:class I SAM-dependent methyltransferase [Lysobacter yangpyeongensis]|uniref:Class I SAM-dependent methyltransferase n=1 Tax=Lysobacter yangpyeongensis TaxID=346182 RepID=A0ABW0SQC0_9GAMM